MRARNSGIRLNESDAAVIKAMIRRGDRQHDIAAWFGVNSGRVAEISTGKNFPSVAPADRANLPPQGPYPTRRSRLKLWRALARCSKQPRRLFGDTACTELGGAAPVALPIWLGRLLALRIRPCCGNEHLEHGRLGHSE